jgi:RNase P protein component
MKHFPHAAVSYERAIIYRKTACLVCGLVLGLAWIRDMAFISLLPGRQLHTFVSKPRTGSCLVPQPGLRSVASGWTENVLSWAALRVENSVRPFSLEVNSLYGKTNSCSIYATARHAKEGDSGRGRSPSSQRGSKKGNRPRRGGRSPSRKSEQQCFVLTASPCREPKKQPIFEVRTGKAAFGKRATLRARARRRLRAAARQVLPVWGRDDFSYLIQGLPETLYVPWKDLLQEMVQALEQAGCMQPPASGSCNPATETYEDEPSQVPPLDDDDLGALDAAPLNNAEDPSLLHGLPYKQKATSRRRQRPLS